MSSTSQSGCACRTSAAAPALCGEAIDVPERIAKLFPVPLPAEKTLTPGAVTSGFRWLSPFRGPPDEKLAKPVKFGFGISAATTLPVLPAPCARRFADGVPAVAWLPATPRNGIVTTNG